MPDHRPTNRGRRRKTTVFAFLINPAFHAGVSDFRQEPCPWRDDLARRDMIFYENGRLFAAHCLAAGKSIPRLPSRGHRERDFTEAFALLFEAWATGSLPQ